MLNPGRLAERRRSVWRRARSEDGMAMVLVFLIVTTVLMLLGVAMASGAFSARRSVEDNRVKRALQAADSGVKAATYRINVISLQGLLQSTVPCLLPKATGQSTTGPIKLEATAELGNTWCPPVTEDGGNDTAFTYQVSRVEGEATISTTCVLLLSCQVALTRTIVSTGTACAYGDVNCAPGSVAATSRRIRVKVSGQITVRRLAGNLVSIQSPARFSQIEYVECRPRAASGQPPDDGC